MTAGKDCIAAGLHQTDISVGKAFLWQMNPLGLRYFCWASSNDFV